MNDPVKMFKDELEKRGFCRKFKVAANLIPPPPGADGDELIGLQKMAARETIVMYARSHEDFSNLLAKAAVDHLFEDVLTDDLFTPDEGFVPTAKEQADMDKAKATAEVLKAMFGGLADILKHI